MPQTFETKMDNTVKIITTIVHFGLLPIPFFLYAKAGLFETLIFVALIVPIFVLTYLLRPFAYVVDEQNIWVKKNILAKQISIDNIASISLVAYKDLKIRLRLWGSGGLWGWFGIFASWAYGNVNLQITEKNNLVLIVTKEDKHIVLSPSEALAFAEIVKKHMQVLKKQKS